VGTYAITGAYPGDSNYAPSTSSVDVQTVGLVQTKSAIAANPDPAFAGVPVAITATVTPLQGVVTPTVTFTFADTFKGATVSLGTAAVGTTGTATINPTLVAGTHSIVATYAGDTDDGTSASVALSLPVNLGTTTTTVAPAPNPALVQAAITFTATVTGNGATPTGSVSFFANGTTALGTSTLGATGTAQVSYSNLAAGTYQITAVYAGDANNAGSTSTAVAEVVGTLPTTTYLDASTVSSSNRQVILVATVQNQGVNGPPPTGMVTFTSGTTVVGTATLDANQFATFTPNLPAGNYTIVAKYGGDTLHSPSTSAPVTVSAVASDFTLLVTPAAVTVASSQSATVTLSLASISGFADTIGLGCASLPAGVNCHFSSVNVALAANGTAPRSSP
jgi:hypothetical protein